jgi:hypothetical protein
MKIPPQCLQMSPPGLQMPKLRLRLQMTPLSQQMSPLVPSRVFNIWEIEAGFPSLKNHVFDLKSVKNDRF